MLETVHLPIHILEALGYLDQEIVYKSSLIIVTIIYCNIRRAAPSENVPSNMRKMRRFRPFYACAKCHPGICSPFIHSKVSNESVSGQ